MAVLRVNPPALLRWATVVPAALLAVFVAQALIMSLAGFTLSSFYISGPDWVIWAVKSVASLFMGSAFVAGAAWAASSSRRVVPAVAAVVVVGWGLMLTVGAGTWGPIMGGLGVVGALAVSSVVWQARPNSIAARHRSMQTAQDWQVFVSESSVMPWGVKGP